MPCILMERHQECSFSKSCLENSYGFAMQAARFHAVFRFNFLTCSAFRRDVISLRRSSWRSFSRFWFWSLFWVSLVLLWVTWMVSSCGKAWFLAHHPISSSQLSIIVLCQLYKRDGIWISILFQQRQSRRLLTLESKSIHVFFASYCYQHDSLLDVVLFGRNTTELAAPVLR